MSVPFKKPKGMKYTDMCIYIDEHMKEVQEPDKNPQIEEKIYEYLFHIIYALSYKQGYFKTSVDHEEFALYAAAELFLSMRRKLQIAGTQIRGKEVVPVKSCLNFIKATLFPLKVNFQRDQFSSVLDPALHDNISNLSDKLKEQIQDNYRDELGSSYMEALKSLPMFINLVLDKTPFRNDPVMREKLYLSICLTLIRQLRLPERKKQKIEQKIETVAPEKTLKKYQTAYRHNDYRVVAWHLDPRFANYVRLLINRVKEKFSLEVNYYVHGNEISDEILTGILRNSYDNNMEANEDKT